MTEKTVNHGRFITIEGIEGVGKSTNLAFVQRMLTDKGLDVCITREPGGTTLAEQLRELLLTQRKEGMVDDAELLLMFAARADHIARVIRPALQRGAWVVSDRFTDATYAYQGGGRGIAVQRIDQLKHWVQGDLQPDLTLLLDAPVALGLQRVGKRGKKDRFEKEAEAFFNRVRAAYLALAQQSPQRFRVVDTSRNLATVQASIAAIIDEFSKSAPPADA
ncbi:MAG: dTMP kinase [Gammaproteobacteria bacterium]|nr:dTMP kinase [Gammaproteobacteria bacterium]